jgi:hypothetical protein
MEGRQTARINKAGLLSCNKSGPLSSPPVSPAARRALSYGGSGGGEQAGSCIAASTSTYLSGAPQCLHDDDAAARETPG